MEQEALLMRQHFANNLDTIINVTGVGLWDWDLTTGKIMHSGQLERIAGYQDGEMPEADRSARDTLIHPGDRKRADDVIAACVAGRMDSYETEFRIVCRDGSTKWVQDRGAVAQRDKAGKATRIVGMFYDVNRFKNAEESLTEKVRLLDFAAGTSGLGTMDWDIATGQLSLDDEFMQIFGYPEEESAKTFGDLARFVHADDMGGLEESIRVFLGHNDPDEVFSRQLRVRHRDGRDIWVTATARIVEWDIDGTPNRAFVGVLNVDRLVRAEMDARAALRENQLDKEQLEQEVATATKGLDEMRKTSVAMFDANPYMSMIFDEGFRAIDCNPAVLEYFGYTDKEKLLEDIPGILHNAIPAHQPDGRVSLSLQQRLEIVMKQGLIEFETWFNFTGKLVPMSVIGKRIRYLDGYAVVAYLVDMSAIKKTENELLRQDELLQAANEVASLLVRSGEKDFSGVLITALERLGQSLGVDRAYVWQNTEERGTLYAEALAEWVDDDGAGYLDHGERRFCYDDILPDWRGFAFGPQSSINAPVAALAERPELANYPGLSDVESVLLIPLIIQGNFWGYIGFDDCQNKGRVFTQSEENIMRASGILIASAALRNEMTENLVAAKEAALAGSRAKSDFLSKMSHEMRTPLNAIIGMAAIARKTSDAEKMQYCLERVEAASHQLLDLINDVLDMSKIEANKLEISPNEFDFERMVQNVVNVSNVRMEEKGLELNFDFKKLFERKVYCDELRLGQVLINLLSNATKFTPAGGHIDVTVDYRPKGEDTHTLHVEVQDSGIGLSDEQQKRLFRAFEQADGSTTRQYGGTGLGLAICKSIVQLMGGDIWVDSRPGEGATFTFEVDFGWGAPLDEAIESGEERLPLRVLVVDDSEETLTYFSNVLHNFVNVCDTAAGGRQAVALAEKAAAGENPYDVIFVDWRMPDMNGKETADALRKVDAGHALVMISAADKDSVLSQMEDTKVDSYLPKPVLPSTLYNTLTQLRGTARPAATPRQQAAARSYNWKDKHILLVEDIEINREIILSILEETQVLIDCATDGLEALEAYEREARKYDLILMDVQMPRMDGYEATRKLRASGLPRSAEVPIIAMTANAFNEDVQACLAAGMNDHVAKPVDMEKLYLALATHLER